jgi:hypothetical protein
MVLGSGFLRQGAGADAKLINQHLDYQVMSSKDNPPAVKSLNELTLRNAGQAASSLAARWAEARLVYPLYAAAAAQFDLAPLPYAADELPPLEPISEVFDRDTKWLDEVDDKLRAFQIRQLHPEILNASEPRLNAFIQRQLRKPDKAQADQDKIDLLLVQYFALCASVDLYRGEITLRDVAQVLQPVLQEADFTPLEWCEPLEEILVKLERCQSLRDLMEEGLLEKGRILKNSAGPMFYDPAALVAFCRFNFLLRRAFIRLLHADLSAVSQTIEALDANGARSVDCRRAGFSAAETIAQLRHFCENWRQPFQKDYTEISVRQAFEQLLALRADLEEALAGFRSKRTSPITESAGADPNEDDAMALMREGPVHVDMVVNSEPVEPDEDEPAVEITPEAIPSETKVAGKPGAPVLDLSVDATAAQQCLEVIWEQLKAAPASKNASMFTVRLQDTKVLLSSWEAAAFLSPAGQESEDLRRAVVARTLVAVATDQRKRSGERKGLAASLEFARGEVAYFQTRVEHAKIVKDTEAAVNLEITNKRLRSVIEAAEKL